MKTNIAYRQLICAWRAKDANNIFVEERKARLSTAMESIDWWYLFHILHMDVLS